MDINELAFTATVLEKAKELRKIDNREDLNNPSIEPPNLDPYVKQAVQELKAWNEVVMEELNKED